MDARPAAGAGERHFARLAAVGQDDDLAGLAHDDLLGKGLAGVGGGKPFFQREADGPHEGLVQVQFLEDEARERADLFEDGVRAALIRKGKIKIHQKVIDRLVASYRG